MSKLSLYYLPLSPPSRACLITAHLLGLKLELIPVNLLAGEHLKPEFVKVCTNASSDNTKTDFFYQIVCLIIAFPPQLNPQHTIPLLRDGDDIVVYDSHAICTYLVEKYGAAAQQQHLYPKDLVKRAGVDARLHLDSGVLFARLRMLYEPILYHGYDKLDADKVEYVQRAWPLLEAILANNGAAQPYLCGAQLTLGDVAAIATVVSIDRVAPIDAAKYPLLLQWVARLAKELPQYEQDCADGGVKLQEYVLSKVQ